MRNTKISWCEHTANLWHGCTKVHAGCDHCYAESLSVRWGREIWGNDSPRLVVDSVWKELRKMQAMAAKAGEMHRVFVGSMMDIFEKRMPLIDHKGQPLVIAGEQMTNENVRQHFFRDIIPDCPNLIFLLLTKRPSNINKMIPESWLTDPPGNVMFGTSPCDQKTAETLIPQLLQVNGKKFLSIEPLLGPVKIADWFYPKNIIGMEDESADGKHHFVYKQEIDWVIVGGESGHQARPMHPDWARDIRDQCGAAGIPFFFKQWGEFVSVSEQEGDGRHHTFPDGATLRRIGKKYATHTLDGRTHDAFPWGLFTDCGHTESYP